MRKFLGLVFCFIVLTSSAQLKLGISAGYDIAEFATSGGSSQDYSISAINGYHVGLIADNKLSKKFFLITELQFAHKGGIVDKTSQALTGTSYTMTLNYLQLPVTLNYKTDISKSSKLILGGGFYGAVGLSGKIKGTSYYNTITNIDENVAFSNNSSNTNVNAVKPIDFGYTFNAGVEWKEYQFKFNYLHGFGSTKPTGSTKFANQTYGLSVAYLLPW
jgi:hypothetical protein